MAPVRTLIVDDHAEVRFAPDVVVLDARMPRVDVVSKDRFEELSAAVLRAAGRR